MTAGHPDLSRRGLLGVVAAAGLAACSAPAAPTSAGTSSAPPSSATPTPSPSGPAPGTTPSPTGAGGGGPVTLPAVSPYRPLPGEVAPACKSAAVSLVTRALTWSRSDGADIASRLPSGSTGRALARAFAPLLTGDAASAVEVVYPQYGGLDDRLSTASVMLVGRQVLLARAGGRPRSREFVVDVRLSRGRAGWAVIGAAVGRPPRPAGPDGAARALLANRRVVLPAPARADVAGGLVGPEVTGLLGQLSRQWRLHVHVLRTGHPVNVFDTDRLSNHTRGRAVDIWAIDGTPLIGAPRRLWEPVVVEAARLGSTEIGAPGMPPAKGLPSVFFTNATHQDHLHLGFEVGTAAPQG